MPITSLGRTSRAIATAAFAWLAATMALAAADNPILEATQAAEQQLKARVGVMVHDTGSGRTWRHRADERFPMASTAKALVCAALLKQGTAAMDRSVRIAAGDVLSYAPVTQHLVGQTATAAELCAITLRTSDNTAVNAVLNVLGGPDAVTAFLRTVGDSTTRLDRNEPALNEGQPGDPRDTTTPEAMARTLQAVVLGDALDAGARAQLTDWLIRNEVGGPLLRAGLPSDWRIADRTGAGGFGTRGVVAVMWPPGRGPVVAVVYLTETDASMAARNTAIAAIGRAIEAAVMR